MSLKDLAYFVFVLVITIGPLVGIAYFLQKRKKTPVDTNLNQKERSSIEKYGLWIIRGLLAILVLLLIAGLVFWDLTFIWIAFGFLVIELIIWRIYIWHHLVEMAKK